MSDQKPWERYRRIPVERDAPLSGPWERFGRDDPKAPEAEGQGSEEISTLGEIGRYAGGMVDAVTNGFTGGLGAKLTAAEAALLHKVEGDTWDERYQKALEMERAQNDEFQEDYPVSRFVGETGGLVTSMAGGPLGAVSKGVTRFIPKAATGGQKLARATAVGGVEGGLAGATYAAGDDKNIGEGALTGALMGAGAGAAVSAGGNALAKALRRRQVAKAAKPHRAMTQAVDDEYNAFRGENVAYTPKWAERTAEAYQKELQGHALSRRMAPEAHAVYDDLMEVAGRGDAVSAEWAENLRRSLSRASANRSNPNLAYASGSGARVIEKAMASAKQSDIAAGGGAEKAAEALARGRAAHRRALASEEVRKVVDSAKGGYASGEATALRNGLRGIVRKAAKDKKYRSLWRDEELSAIREAADGGPVDNLMRQVGKMGFAGVGQGSSGLGGSIGHLSGSGVGAAIGSAMGGIPGGVVGAGVGGLASSALTSAARRASDASMSSRAKLIEALVRSGGSLPSPGKGQQLLARDAVRDLLVEAIIGARLTYPEK